jgi:hypothetical protein
MEIKEPPVPVTAETSKTSELAVFIMEPTIKGTVSV